MLILALTALAAITQVAPPSSDQEIVVIGRRLQSWSGKYSIKGSKMSCRTKRSTGDRAIDAIGCSAFETCAGQLESRIRASDVSGLARDARMTMKAAIKQDLSACVSTRRTELIAELSSQRSQIRN